MRSTAGAGSLDRASWRPAGHLLSRSSATRGDRHEEKQQQSTRSTASSTASSPAVSKHVRTSCHHLGIGICSSSPKFSACGAEQVSKQVRANGCDPLRFYRTSSPTWKISPASGRCSSCAFIQLIKPVFFNTSLWMKETKERKESSTGSSEDNEERRRKRQ